MAYHADTDDYLSRLATAGGTITAFNADLLDTKIRYAYAHGLRGATDYLKYWLCLNLTQSFTGCLVPVYDDGVGNATNNGFVSGDWSSTLGLTGNGTTKYLNSNYAFPASLGSFTLGGRSDFHLGAFVSSPESVGSYPVLMGGGTAWGSATAWALAFGTGGDRFTFFLAGRDISQFKSAPDYESGFYLGNQVDKDNGRILKNNTLLNSKNEAPSSVLNTTNTIFLFGSNSGGSLYSPSASSFSNFTMGFGLTTTAQETALYNMLSITQPYYASPLMLSACF